MTTPMAWIRADKNRKQGKGRTMMEKRVIPFSPPDISELEINEVAEALRSGWITTGPRTKELERMKNHVNVFSSPCSGCGACATICPKNAITITLDNEGL